MKIRYKRNVNIKNTHQQNAIHQFKCGRVLNAVTVFQVKRAYARKKQRRRRKENETTNSNTNIKWYTNGK